MKPTPVKNLVDEISLRSNDALLPIFEPIINSINSINLKNPDSPSFGKIIVEIERQTENENLFGPPPIKDVTIYDNGEGFTSANMDSFEIPHSHKNKALGCKGMGRFTCLAAFRELEIKSTFFEKDEWGTRHFRFDARNEIQDLTNGEVIVASPETIVKLIDYNNLGIVQATCLELDEFAEKLMNHCLIFYLNKQLPDIKITDLFYEKSINLKDKYEELAQENEKEFEVKGEKFRAYILRTPKKSNRKNHYVHYCANSREVGNGRSLSSINKIFNYPLQRNGSYYYLDVYVVSDYLDRKVNQARNTINIPSSRDSFFADESTIVFTDIELTLGNILADEFKDYIKNAQEKAISEIKEHIKTKSPQYRRYLEREDILKSIPPFSDDEAIEEHLHRVAYKEKKAIDEKIDKHIQSEVIDENLIQAISKDLKEKTIYDSDGLAEYMSRRKSILQLFDRLLEADGEGKYKLEEDIHNLIMPMGISGTPAEEGHNLWLLDERFVTYSFIASDIPLTRVTQVKSSKEPDIFMWKEGTNILDKPTAYGSSPSGNVNSLVVFEFKRPGETAHQKKKSDKHWLFSDLINPYFDAFIYGDGKKNYKGRQVNIEKHTPKFGYVIVDVIPKELREYNTDKGFKPTPYGTLYKIEPELNLHIEVITFRQLIDSAALRHKPFFDRLFG
jgi:hypothetical protein